MYNHKYDIRNRNTNSPIVKHGLDNLHSININNPETLINISNNNKRKIFETVIIYNSKNYNRDQGNFKLDSVQNNYIFKSKTFKRTLKQLPTSSSRNERNVHP